MCERVFGDVGILVRQPDKHSDMYRAGYMYENGEKDEWYEKNEGKDENIKVRVHRV